MTPDCHHLSLMYLSCFSVASEKERDDLRLLRRLPLHSGGHLLDHIGGNWFPLRISRLLLHLLYQLGFHPANLPASRRCHTSDPPSFAVSNTRRSLYYLMKHFNDRLNTLQCLPTDRQGFRWNLLGQFSWFLYSATNLICLVVSTVFWATVYGPG